MKQTDENYTVFAQILFKAESREEMYDRLWELERILDENKYYLKQHHTAKTHNLRSVRNGV